MVLPAGGKNLVPNGSFERGRRLVVDRNGAGWGDLDRLHGTIEAAARRASPFSAYPLGGARTPVSYFDYFDPLVKRELRPLAASLGWIKVEKGAAYTLSCDLRRAWPRCGRCSASELRILRPAAPTTTANPRS